MTIIWCLSPMFVNAGKFFEKRETVHCMGDGGEYLDTRVEN